MPINKKKRAFNALFAFLAAISFSGCAVTTFTPAKISKPVLMNNYLGKEYTAVKSFNKTYSLWWLLYGLVPVEQADFFYLIENELKASEGDAIVHLRIEGRHNFWEGLATIATAGLLFGREYTLSGEIVKYKTTEKP